MFTIKVVNKTAPRTAPLAKCILLHAYSRATAIKDRHFSELKVRFSRKRQDRPAPNFFRI